MTQKCKILTILGARPQFIKAATVSRALRRRAENFEEIVVHTGQHFDYRMSDVFFKELEMPKIRYNLGIDSLSHGAMTGRMLEAIENIIRDETPDYILVYGDTNSTLAGALAGKKLHKKIIHIEAGLRSFDNRMPEEINRILTDRIADLLFCPTEKSAENLRAEGFEHFPVKIIKSGDVMFDSYLFFKNKTAARKNGEKFILCTLHRAENTNDELRLTTILEDLEEINRRVKIVFPIHPRTRKSIENLNVKCSFPFIEPIGYLEMIELLESCEMVITDSGGLQKEAFFAKKICLILRDSTEWTELTENGFNELVPVEKTRIIEAFEKNSSRKIDFSADFYGDGNAAEIIADEIRKDFSGF